MKRTSVVDTMQIISITNGSIYEIGDAYLANPASSVIALQKEGRTYKGNLEFEDYTIFRQKPNLPSTLPKVTKHTMNHQPFIHVNQTSIIAVSTSSIVQVGSLNHIKADARLKHFRIILVENDMNST